MYWKYMLQFSMISPVDKNLKIAASLILGSTKSRMMVLFFLTH